MKKFYPQFTAVLATVTILVLSSLALSLRAQPVQASHAGVIRIKVTEALAAKLESRKFSQSSTGEVITGIPGLDNKNRQFKAKRYRRVFRDAGRNESRHRKHGLHLWYEVTMDKGSSVSDAVRAYGADKDILKAEPVYKKRINGSTNDSFGPVIWNSDELLNRPALSDGANDPMLGSQWHYHNTGQTGGTAGADIGLLEAWKIETGKSDVIVAVTDGGIQTDHPDLAQNIWVNADEIAGNNIDDDHNGFVDDRHGYNFVYDSGPIEQDSHGTHVAGTIAAVSNNGQGVAGIAGGSGSGDGVRLMSCAVFSDYADPAGFPESYVYAADNGAVISQNSWGYNIPGLYEDAVVAAIDYFIAEAGKDEYGNQTGPMNGGLVIFSAGNSTSEEHYYPGFYEPVLAVAASTHKDLIAGYSNYGSWVDITAPGGETYARPEEGVLSTLTDGQYGSFMGTSMACPHVSGVAALIVSRYGKEGFRPEALRERLRHSVDNIDGVNPGYAGKLGLGRLNAVLALTDTDGAPPKAVTDLAVAGKDIGEITLTWTSPQDESGFVTAYDLRYSTAPITSANFANAISAGAASAPEPVGAPETFTVRNLKGGFVYYFALRSTDFQGNVSAISNVVSEEAVLTPVIVVTPASLTENLRTAETSTQTFNIKNSGEGPLKFILRDADENDFTSASPMEGVVPPGGDQEITITFDANGLFAGTYETSYIIENNDPENDSVFVSATLKVENNHAPIASVAPSEVDFLSAQTGTTVRRTIAISNAGSNPLIIHNVTTSGEMWGADFDEDIQIESFTEQLLDITFSPAITGHITGVVSLHTNDPVNSILRISVSGEGLSAPPFTVSPRSFEETLDAGTNVTRVITLQNNGSQERSFRIEVANMKIAAQQPGAQLRSGATTPPSDSAALSRRRVIEKHQAVFAAKHPEQVALFKPMEAENGGVVTPDRYNGDPVRSAEIIEYATGFDEFNPGSVGGQHGWFSTQGWSVSTERPYGGIQHFRGKSAPTEAAESYAVSPYMPYYEDNFPRYTSTTMLLNLDDARGETWEVVTQAVAFIANRIRFNPDGTIEALAIDNDYEHYWKKAPVKAPAGYFELGIEYNNWGSDTSGFPTYHLFINRQHILSGTGLGFCIAQVAIVSNMQTPGPAFDMDNFRMFNSEIVPRFIVPSPSEGIIPPGGSAEVAITVDASIMKFGSYESDIIFHFGEVDSLVVPAGLNVTGPAEIYVEEPASMEADKGEAATSEITLMNEGGRPIEFSFDYDLPGLVLHQNEGVLAVRETRKIKVTFDGPPGMYNDTIVLHTDVEGRPPQEMAVNVIVFDSGAVFSAPDEIDVEIMAGQVVTRKIQLRNDGVNTVSFALGLPAYTGWVTLNPMAGTIAEKPADVFMTLDGKGLTPGQGQTWINVNTNDKNLRYHRITVNLNILADTSRHGMIDREVWSDVPGNTVWTIPVDTPPDSTGTLTIFETPANEGDHYGSRVRGYVVAPMTGYYTFWISGNDHSHLSLSRNSSIPEWAEGIASVPDYTNPRQWDKYESQRSERIYLEANRPYYIEALHKEGVGSDHLAVGWQLPDGTMERPIPGRRLRRYGLDDNQAPTVSLPGLSDGQMFSAPATIYIEADAVDADGMIASVEFYGDSTKLGTDTTAPFAFTWDNVPEGEYLIEVVATDNLGATDTLAVNILVTEGNSCAQAGYIEREQWNGIAGTAISSIPLDTDPSLTDTLRIFESPSDIGDHYGARIRGYLCVPEDGAYTFWIASNDKSELWLSTDSSPAHKILIASVSRYTSARQWTKEPSQQSAAVTLRAGERYYIEALHKEGVGSDHLAVGWQLPDGTMERPIPGMRLVPFGESVNHPPVLSIVAPADGMTFTAPATVAISADVSDPDGNVLRVEFFSGTNKVGEDPDAPYAFTWARVPAGDYTITAVATDAMGASATSLPVSIIVDENCTASGTITREYWTDVAGSGVADIPLNSTPDGTESLTEFAGPVNAGTNYGARISGYICAPATGDYYFWIASNDHSELWLSKDENPYNKVRIASVTGATGVGQWDKFASQMSVAIPMVQGSTYYIEALHKQGAGTDHVAVGWQLPDGTLERPISGSRLSPLYKAGNAAARSRSETYASVPLQSRSTDPAIMVYPNPVKGRKLTINLATFATADSAPEIEIRQITGLSMYSERVKCSDGCQTVIDFSEGFPPGVYILQVRIDGRTLTEKLVLP